MASGDAHFQGSERDVALDFLDFLRGAVLKAVEGLDEEQARRRLVPSLTTLGGLVKHLADVERWWFQVIFAGEQDVDMASTRDDPDAHWRMEDSDTLAGVITRYREAIDAARAICRDADFDDLSRRRADGRQVNLRWVVVHMIEETGRHAGHADILREQVDGVTAT